MKKYLYSIVIFSTIFLLNSCKVDEFEDWKNLNERYYNAKLASAAADSFQISHSGLMYKIIEPGHQNLINDVSLLYVSYEGKLIDGTVFATVDSTLLYQTEVVAGWREALKKVRNGGIVQFIMPASLGYGTTDNGMIPPYSTLIYKVKVIDVGN